MCEKSLFHISNKKWFLEKWMNLWNDNEHASVYTQFLPKAFERHYYLASMAYRIFIIVWALFINWLEHWRQWKEIMKMIYLLSRPDTFENPQQQKIIVSKGIFKKKKKNQPNRKWSLEHMPNYIDKSHKMTHIYFRSGENILKKKELSPWHLYFLHH